MVKNFSIAIDGPASAGKSTIAKRVAEKLGLTYLDTGAMYRSLTYAAVMEQIPFSNEEKLVELLKKSTISFAPGKKNQQVFLNGEDVTEQIREVEVTNHVSEVSSHPEVRAEMVARQQKIAAEGGIVMDGRDIGTVVMPRADLKIFLSATAEERALRRYREMLEKGMEVSLDQLTEDMQKRDYYDTHRSASPLKKAEDAIELNTTDLSIEEVTDCLIELLHKKNRKNCSEIAENQQI